MYNACTENKFQSKGKFFEAHDYKAQGQIVDFVVIMTYDWGWRGGPPMAISPIGPVKEVLQYAKSQMPPQKIMMGQRFIRIRLETSVQTRKPTSKSS